MKFYKIKFFLLLLLIFFISRSSITQAQYATNGNSYSLRECYFASSPIKECNIICSCPNKGNRYDPWRNDVFCEKYNENVYSNGVPSGISCEGEVTVPILDPYIAEPTTPTNACDDPVKGNTTECLRQILEINKIDTSGIFAKNDPLSLITTIAQFILGIVVIAVVTFITRSGIKIAGAKEDADKRKEGFQSMFSAIIGLAVSVSALGLTIFVKNVINRNTEEKLLITCEELRNQSNIDPEIITQCEKLRND